MASLSRSIGHFPIKAPTVLPPVPAIERRRAPRRAADLLAAEGAGLLTAALDIVVAEAPAEQRLADILALLAGTVGARRAAVLTGDPDRRVAVVLAPAEDPVDARALAVWLDQQAPRTRAERAAAGPAPVLLVQSSSGSELRPGAVGKAPREASLRAGGRHLDPVEARFALTAIPSAGPVHLGFEMAGIDAVLELPQRLSPTLARHAAVALALVTTQVARDQDLASSHAREFERDRFISSVAHDLRTPLTALDGYLELILAGRVGDPKVTREFLDRSRGIVESMADLVADLLDISRLDSGSIPLEIAPFSVAEVANRAIAALAPLALERRMEIFADLPPRIRAATGDRRHVERILTNLIGNALKFTPEGGRVEVVARFDGLIAVLTVRDDGAGIEPEDLERIFERFYRMSGHQSVTGTGLGLPIARDLARAMGGDLGVASLAGAGSSFILALPGPAPAPPDALQGTLKGSIVREEAVLTEAAVRRSMPGAGGPARPTTGGGARRIRSLDRLLAKADAAAR